MTEIERMKLEWSRGELDHKGKDRLIEALIKEVDSLTDAMKEEDNMQNYKEDYRNDMD